MRVALRLMARQRMVNLFVTNVPGPPLRLYLAGAPCSKPSLHPAQRQVTLGIAALSYAGQLHVTAVADPEACPDVDVFAEGMKRSFAALAELVPVAAS